MKYIKLAYFYYRTTIHKALVMWYILKACLALIKRGFKHDISKYSKRESRGFSKLVLQHKKSKYQSQEYQDLLKELEPTLIVHYSKNRHHPEFYHAQTFDGKKTLSEYSDEVEIYCMSWLDRVEMMCDWAAATKNHKPASEYYESARKNQERFHYSNVERGHFINDGKEIGLW